MNFLFRFIIVLFAIGSRALIIGGVCFSLRFAKVVAEECIVAVIWLVKLVGADIVEIQMPCGLTLQPLDHAW